MKKQIIKLFSLLVLAGGIASCGNDFLDTPYYKGVESETALNSVTNITTALNGTYYRLFHYYFAGNYAINIGDIGTDITYWNAKTGHWDKIYNYTLGETESYLRYSWEYGYKVIDNSARIIKASKALYDDATASEKTELNRIMAEAYALRGYAQLLLVNIFAHQVKVNGTDHSSSLGIVIVDEPIEPWTDVSRSTVGQSYAAILSDFTNSLSYFEAAGKDRGNVFFMNVAAVHGLMARANLYLENWSAAIQSAQNALDTKGITTLNYGSSYKPLYNGGASNTESLFTLDINETQSWAASSSGTFWSTYSYSPSPKLLSLYGAEDCRTTIFNWDKDSTPNVPIFAGGKFSHFSSGNPANGTNYIVNAPEMFLIIAEATLQLEGGSISDAQTALLTVAKRNAAITSTADLPSTADGLMAFIKDERARELFQEGMRLYDVRRWDERIGVYAYGAPDIKFSFEDYQISKLVYPIPSIEVNSGWGVEQNAGWNNTLPE